MSAVVRVELPASLRVLAGTGCEVHLTVEAAPQATLHAVLDALEAAYPVLRGTIRDQATGERRAFLRFFACLQDLSQQPLDAPLPGPVCRGEEPLLIIGAIAGG